ncbi:MAG: hypothetical protein ACLVML_05645 [Candidatus Gastranaerophilaceae bacterium]|jgi:hypothetical protein|nr:hypothetical protein [Christensenellales bacterium]
MEFLVFPQVGAINAGNCHIEIGDCPNLECICKEGPYICGAECSEQCIANSPCSPRWCAVKGTVDLPLNG